MTAHPRSVPEFPAPVIIGAALIAALVAGRLFAEGRIPMALAIMMAASYVPLVFLDYGLALALWASMLYVEHLSALSVAPTAMAMLLVIGWLASGMVLGRSRSLPVVDQHRRLFAAVVLFALWLGLSRIWTDTPGTSDVELSYWTGPLAFFVVAMTVNATRQVRIIVIALVAGAVVSVLIGFAGGGLATSGESAKTAAEGRLTGGGGDPNTQAAGYIAAIFLAGGLLGIVRRPAARTAVMAAMAIITFGFFATQSRGGLIAIGIAALSAFILVPRYRARILAFVVATATGLAVFLSSNPEALDRLSKTEGGNPRQDLWTVAWRVFQDNPVVGAGLNSFQDVSPRYVLEPGPLEYVRLIAEAPHAVHNSYLQLLAETGVVGLAVFAFIIVASLRSCWLAARRFEAIGQSGQANLARAVMTGAIGMLAAMFFVSDLFDFRIWILFALGPVMLALARRAGAEEPQLREAGPRRFAPRAPTLTPPRP